MKWAISTIPVVDGFTTVRRCHGERRFAELLKLLADDRRKRFETGGAGGTMPMSSADPENELSAWPYPDICKIFDEIKKAEVPNHEHWTTIESVEPLLDCYAPAYCRRIVDTPVMVSVARGDDITSADLEIEAFNAIYQSEQDHRHRRGGHAHEPVFGQGPSGKDRGRAGAVAA